MRKWVGKWRRNKDVISTHVFQRNYRLTDIALKLRKSDYEAKQSIEKCKSAVSIVMKVNLVRTLPEDLNLKRC